MRAGIFICCLLLLTGCSTKKNNFFTRNYHQLTTRYNVYFNGNEALKSGVKKMEVNHKEDYTNLLPVFVSNNEQTRAVCGSDMDYAIEKAVKAIDKHSITSKPRRKKNKDSKSYETFRKKKEFNKQIDKCYLLLGKAYFYKKKYAMANNTFRFIQRQYGDDEKLMTEVKLWLFRSLTEMGRYDEAGKCIGELEGAKLNKKQREMFAASKTDFYIRQANYGEAVGAGEQLVSVCKSMKRRPRYNFMLSQLYLKQNQEAQAMYALKKAARLNFNYEMVFNAKINMALAYQAGDEGIRKKLNKMLKDRKNTDFQDRIYYALGNIEEKKGNQEEAISLYWKSVKTSVDNDNQKALSFLKLGDYYYKEKDYIPAQSCYDSCMYFMDSRVENYDALKILVTDLTELVSNLNTIQRQDSLQKLAAMPEGERNAVIDSVIQKLKEAEQQQKELEQQAQLERNFFQRNDMVSRGDAFSQSSSGDWYFYNPVTVSLGKNDFKRKWGRRKLEDNWRRQNKAMVDFAEDKENIAEETKGEKEKLDVKSREYYLKDIPLTDESKEVSEKMIEKAYYKAGELYMYKFNDPSKALECFAAFIDRFAESTDLPLVYYLAYAAAEKAGEHGRAEKYKEELAEKFPESDFAKGLLDPEYFKKVDDELRVINRMYQEAFEKYQHVYYQDALSICDDIMKRYPSNKLNANVLFLRAMCVVNLSSEQDAREALNKVLAAKPDKEITTVVNSVMASLDVGDKPVVYADGDMANARYLKSTRNWVFDEKGNAKGEDTDKENPFQADKAKEHYVVVAMPEDIKTMHTLQIQGRLAFINAAEKVSGSNFETKKEDLWYKMPAFVTGSFENYDKASAYLMRVATDKVLLKNLSGKSYRIFAISKDNLSALKRLKEIDQYVDFFTKNYFEDRYRGEVIAGKQGTAAHIFSFSENDKHDFVLMLPFRKVNVKRIAETLISLERAFVLEKEDYDEEYECIVVKGVGTKAQALEYRDMVLKNKDIFDRLAGVEYQEFAITSVNMKTLLDEHNIDEYMKFFEDNYLKSVNGQVGVEDGDFIYNKSVSHKFVLLFSNKVDPFKLKSAFEEFNFAGLSVNNYRYDGEHDCMVVSGFNNREEAMRYFDRAIMDRKLFKALRNTDYRNFIISDGNFEVMKDKQLIDEYLLFFKKYYLND